MNIIHCLTIIIILKTYLNMGKQTDGSLSIEIKIKLFTYSIQMKIIYIFVQSIKLNTKTCLLLYCFCFVLFCFFAAKSYWFFCKSSISRHFFIPNAVMHLGFISCHNDWQSFCCIHPQLSCFLVLQLHYGPWLFIMVMIGSSLK